MKKLLILLSVLLLLAACAPQVPVQPVVSQEAVVQAGIQPPRPAAVQPQAVEVVAPEVQAPPSAEVSVAQAGKTVNAVIEKFAFNPAEIRIKAGDTVVWTNKDSAPHDVSSTSPEQRFESSVLRTGDSFSRQFNQPGTYSYKCSLHPVMRGVIVVE